MAREVDKDEEEGRTSHGANTLHGKDQGNGFSTTGGLRLFNQNALTHFLLLIVLGLVLLLSNRPEVVRGRSVCRQWILSSNTDTEKTVKRREDNCLYANLRVNVEDHHADAGDLYEGSNDGSVPAPDEITSQAEEDHTTHETSELRIGNCAVLAVSAEQLGWEVTVRFTVLGSDIGRNGASAVGSLSTNLGGVKYGSVGVQTTASNVLGALDLKIKKESCW